MITTEHAHTEGIWNTCKMKVEGKVTMCFRTDKSIPAIIQLTSLAVAKAMHFACWHQDQMSSIDNLSCNALQHFLLFLLHAICFPSIFKSPTPFMACFCWNYTIFIPNNQIWKANQKKVQIKNLKGKVLGSHRIYWSMLKKNYLMKIMKQKLYHDYNLIGLAKSDGTIQYDHRKWETYAWVFPKHLHMGTARMK